MEMKFHSQAKVQYECSFLKIIKNENSTKEDGITYKTSRKQPPCWGEKGRTSAVCHPSRGITATSLRGKHRHVLN